MNILPSRRSFGRFIAAVLVLCGGAVVGVSPARAEQHVPFPDPRLPVFGLGWYAEDAPRLTRLPVRLKDSVSSAVWGLAQQPSGGRIRFRTDSKSLKVEAANPGFSNMHHMASVGENGLDLYVDGHYRASAWPDAQGKIRANWTLGESTSVRSVDVYLPLYKAVTIQEVAVDDGARLESPLPYRKSGPVVYYGSSITQGGCASNPGGSYQAILERRLNVDFCNLGFSGSGLGEPGVAQALTELNPSCLVLDFWANPSLEIYQERLGPFIEILRAKFPQVPILIITPFHFPAERGNSRLAEQQQRKRAAAVAVVQARRKRGDRHIEWVDGHRLLGPDQAEGLVDGVHPNSLGFYFCANGLERPLKAALKLR